MLARRAAALDAVVRAMVVIEAAMVAASSAAETGMDWLGR
jgi:hypothetical protein